MRSVEAIVAGKLLTYVNNNGIFGMTLFGQQVLSAVSLVLTIIVFVFVRFVVSKQKKSESKY